jgi:hypothetical protein
MKAKMRKNKLLLIAAPLQIVSHSFEPFIQNLAEHIPAEFNLRGETRDGSL